MQFNVKGLLCPGSCRAAFFEHSTLVFAMRVSFVYVMLGLCSMTLLFAEEVKSQSLEEIRVTVELNNQSLPQLFTQIENQTGLLFAFRQPELDKVQPLTISKQATSVKAVLDLVFTNTKLRYKQVNYSVIVFEEEPAPVSQPTIQPITGTVTDKSGSPLPGVSIFIKGTTIGTVSDFNGKYTIDAKDEDLLVFSFIGYKTFETSPAARLVIEVVMEEDTKVLGEVTINGGYYETTDKLKTGNITKVNAREIENQPVSSPILALQGRVAGLEVTPTSGVTGIAPTVRLRGNNSLRMGKLNTPNPQDNGNAPLYVIDDVPINSQSLYSAGIGFSNDGGFDPLSSMNLANIESIEVLKDGDATAIYGSRGANGVILITTKRAKTGERTNIDFNIYRGVGKITNRLKLMNTRQYLAMRKEGMDNDGSTPQLNGGDLDVLLWDSTRYTDWQEELLGGTANITDINLGVSAGNRNTSFRFNGGYHKETTIFPGDFSYQKGTGQLSVNHVSANQKFRMDISTTYGMDRNELFYGSNLMSVAIVLPPNAPALRLPDGSLNWEVREINGENVSTWKNPLADWEMIRVMHTQNIMNNASFSYELFPELTISTTAGYSFLTSQLTSESPLTADPPEVRSLYQSGSYGVTDNRRSTWIIEPKVSYAKQIDKHNITMLAGATWQKITAGQNMMIGFNYPSDAMLGSLKGAGNISVPSNENTEYKYVSSYFRVGYNWQDRYLVNLTGRRDGSSRFGPNRRFGNFGAVGAAWIFSNEPFMQAVKFMTLGKFRASYGTTGNDQIADYAYYDLFVSVGEPGGIIGVIPNSLYNPDFRWEVTKKLEAAVELAFFQNRLSTSVSWYRNRTDNQLVSYPLSAITGFESVYTNFDALVQNSGLEIVLSGDVFSRDAWRWNISANVSVQRNKLVRFDGIESSPYANAYKVGQPLTVEFLYTGLGVNPETGLYEIEDRNNDGIYNNSDKQLFNVRGNPFFGGINNSIQFNNIELSFLISFAHQYARPYATSVAPGVAVNQPVWVLRRWQQSGDETDVQRFSDNNDNSYGRYIESNKFIANASFIRLKTLSLGYRFPVQWIERVKLQQARIFIQAQNLFTITKYKKVGIDPETQGQVPPPSFLSLGLQLRF